MATIDLHQKPFDEATITKLEIFENYAKEWLPTFIMSHPNNDLWIFDFFAGTGYDIKGTPGSPIRILQQIKNQTGNIFNKRTRIRVCFNEFEEYKYKLLKNSTEEFISNDSDLERLRNNNLLSIEYRNSDFAELFPKTISTIKSKPSLLYLDQNGMKFLADEYLLTLAELHTTDFLYYLSSSYFIRFGDTIPFQTNLKIDVKRIKENPYKYIHKSILEQLRERIPTHSNLKLYPFTIKKGRNIYGIIFGASHPRAFDKFLKTAWDKNNQNGEANFDIDDDSNKQQLDLFEGQLPTKIEFFQNNLKDLILSKKITTNKDAYDYTLEQGHLDKHANDIIKQMKKDGLIQYDTKSPMANYEQVYKNKKIIEYSLIP
jgi:three-Cys-motif partner protein